MNKRQKPYWKIVRCPKKRQIFAGKNWTNALIVFILYTLPLSIPAGRTAAETVGGSLEPAGATVRLELKDAVQFETAARQLDELNSLREKVRVQEQELGSLRAENSLLKQEMVEIVDKFQKQDAEYRQLQLGIAGALAKGKLPAADERFVQLVRMLNDIAESGVSLALKSVEFCDEVDSVLKALPMEAKEIAGLRLKRDALKTESRKFSALAGRDLAERSVKKSRILAVNRDLQVVVLPVGSIHGAFNGLILKASGKEEAVRLKIVSTRPFVSAAVVEAGNIDDLAPGMEVVTDLENQTRE